MLFGTENLLQATALMQLEPWDFMAVYFDGINGFGTTTSDVFGF